MFNKKNLPDQSNNNNQIIENFRHYRHRSRSTRNDNWGREDEGAYFKMDTLEKIQVWILVCIVFTMIIPFFLLPDLSDLWLWYLVPNDGQRLDRIKNSPIWKYFRNSWFILILLYLTTDVTNLFLSDVPTSRRITIACSTAAAFFIMTVSIKRENTAFSYTSTKLILTALFILSLVMRYKKRRNIERFVCSGNHEEERDEV